MSLTVVTPLPGDPFGPGFIVQVSTDIVGPLVPGSAWQFTLTAPANEGIVAQVVEPFTTNGQTTTILSLGLTHPIPAPGRPEFVSGQSARLRINLEEPGFGVIDTADVAVVLDRQTGLGTELRKWMEWFIGERQAGLTVAEHNAMLQTNVGVIAMSSLNPIDLVGDLAEAISGSPPLGFGSFSTTYTLTGDGEMPDIGDLLHTKLGIYFVATVIPAGLGHRHGQSEEYPARLVQWRTVHTVAGVELVTEVLDYETHGEMLRWRHGKPSRIEYSILPGVTIAARWWQFP